MSDTLSPGEVVIGDTSNPLQLELMEPDGITPTPFPNHEVRVYLRGRASNDRPEAAQRSATCACTKGSKTISRTTGSFLVDGVAVGMLIETSCFPRGAQVTAVTALAVTADTPAAATGTVPVRFWSGLACTITGPGLAQYVGIGAVCDIGAQTSDIYDVRARLRNTANDRIAWYDLQAIRAVRP